MEEATNLYDAVCCTCKCKLWPFWMLFETIRVIAWAYIILNAFFRLFLYTDIIPERHILPVLLPFIPLGMIILICSFAVSFIKEFRDEVHAARNFPSRKSSSLNIQSSISYVVFISVRNWGREVIALPRLQMPSPLPVRIPEPLNELSASSLLSGSAQAQVHSPAQGSEEQPSDQTDSFSIDSSSKTSTSAEQQAQSAITSQPRPSRSHKVATYLVNKPRSSSRSRQVASKKQAEESPTFLEHSEKLKNRGNQDILIGLRNRYKYVKQRTSSQE